MDCTSLWGIEVDDLADGIPQAVHCALIGFAQVDFQLGERLLDRFMMASMVCESGLWG